MNLFVGGPAYRLQVHADHCKMLVGLAWQQANPLPNRGTFYVEHMHTSILPQGRAQWLGMAMLRPDADIAIGVDADTFADPVAVWRLAASLHNSGEDWALCGVAVPQRDGRVNVWAEEFRRITAHELGVGTRVEAHAAGAAICLYNLHWYRQAVGFERDGIDWEGRTATLYASVPTGARMAFLGEDYFHCVRVRELGGRILAARLEGTRHAGGE